MKTVDKKRRNELPRKNGIKKVITNDNKKQKKINIE